MAYNLLTASPCWGSYNHARSRSLKCELVRQITSFDFSRGGFKLLFSLGFLLVDGMTFGYYGTVAANRCVRFNNTGQINMKPLAEGRQVRQKSCRFEDGGIRKLPAMPVTRVWKAMLLSWIMLAMLSPTAALADPNIQLNMTVAKQVEVTEQGHKVTHWVVAKDIAPGQKLRYTVHYVNMGDQPATKVRIENPIPDLTVYVSDSAAGKGSTIVFSADGGKTYEPQGKVTYEAALFGGGTERRKAGPDKYTNIRWLIDRIPAGGTGDVSFVVTVK